jgi:hypothetical protein
VWSSFSIDRRIRPRWNLNVSPELTDGDYVEALSGMKVAVKDGKLGFAVAPQVAAFVTKPEPSASR